MTITRKPSPDNYSERYKRLAFHIWYSRGRPSISKLAHMVDKREDGTSPSQATLQNWSKEHDWGEKADEMDKDAAIQIQKSLINDQVKMFEEHAKIGKSLRMKAVDWLEEHELTKPNEAMRLLELAATMEKESVGLSKIIEKVRDMEDEEVQDRLARLMREGKLNEFDLRKIEDDPKQLEGETSDE